MLGPSCLYHFVSQTLCEVVNIMLYSISNFISYQLFSICAATTSVFSFLTLQIKHIYILSIIVGASICLELKM